MPDPDAPVSQPAYTIPVSLLTPVLGGADAATTPSMTAA